MRTRLAGATAILLAAAAAGAAGEWEFRSAPAGEVAKTLMFPPMGPKELAEQAEMWRGSGVAGFFFHCGEWREDISDPGRAELRNAVVRATRALRAAGMAHNFVKTSYGSLAPDWFDDAAWAKRAAVLGNLARLGREAGCRGVAQDVEYIGEQYHLTWPGYRGMDKAELRLGSDDDVAAWYDGELVWQQVGQRECGVDSDIAPITLKPGWRPLALKVRNQVGGWGFDARFTSSDGRPLPDIVTSPTPP